MRTPAHIRNPDISTMSQFHLPPPSQGAPWSRSWPVAVKCKVRERCVGSGVTAGKLNFKYIRKLEFRNTNIITRI